MEFEATTEVSSNGTTLTLDELSEETGIATGELANHFHHGMKLEQYEVRAIERAFSDDPEWVEAFKERYESYQVEEYSDGQLGFSAYVDVTADPELSMKFHTNMPIGRSDYTIGAIILMEGGDTLRLFIDNA